MTASPSGGISYSGPTHPVGASDKVSANTSKAMQVLMCDEAAGLVFSDPPYNNVPIEGHVLNANLWEGVCGQFACRANWSRCNGIDRRTWLEVVSTEHP